MEHLREFDNVIFHGDQLRIDNRSMKREREIKIFPISREEYDGDALTSGPNSAG